MLYYKTGQFVRYQAEKEVMIVLLLIKITGSVNSLDLWEHIKDYKVNLTDLIEFTYIYGETNINNAVNIIRICALYGPLSIELSGDQ